MALGDKLPVVMGKEKAVAGGVATLGPDGVLSEEQRPSVDAVPTEGSYSPVQSGGVYLALSNKATNLGRVSSPYETVLDVVLSCTTDSSFFVDNASSIYNAADAPFGLNETQYLVSMDATKTRRTVFAVLYDPTRQPQIAIRPAFNDAWILDWTYIPITTPPQEYNLPLASGWTGTAKYFKTQESVCVISLDISKNAELTTGESVGIVPVGFRPSYVKMSPASTFAPSGATTIGVSTDGSILLGDVSGQEQARNIYATIVYIAGN